MSVIAVFIALVIVGQSINVLIASQVERISETVGVLSFLGMFVVVMVGAWILAVFITERYLIRQN